MIGVKPGLVQSTIIQFLERFPNLAVEGPSVRLSFDQTTTGGLFKIKSGHIEGPVAKQSSIVNGVKLVHTEPIHIDILLFNPV